MSVRNFFFRQLVHTNKVLYLTSSREKKAHISQSIVATIRSQNPEGRFLERNPLTGLWYEIGDRRAIEKTSQALREGAPRFRQTLMAQIKAKEGSEAKNLESDILHAPIAANSNKTESIRIKSIILSDNISSDLDSNLAMTNEASLGEAHRVNSDPDTASPQTFFSSFLFPGRGLGSSVESCYEEELGRSEVQNPEKFEELPFNNTLSTSLKDFPYASEQRFKLSVGAEDTVPSTFDTTVMNNGFVVQYASQASNINQLSNNELVKKIIELEQENASLKVQIETNVFSHKREIEELNRRHALVLQIQGNFDSFNLEHKGGANSQVYYTSNTGKFLGFQSMINANEVSTMLEIQNNSQRAGFCRQE